jgi:hypothetical protein
MKELFQDLFSLDLNDNEAIIPLQKRLHALYEKVLTMADFEFIVKELQENLQIAGQTRYDNFSFIQVHKISPKSLANV